MNEREERSFILACAMDGSFAPAAKCLGCTRDDEATAPHVLFAVAVQVGDEVGRHVRQLVDNHAPLPFCDVCAYRIHMAICARVTDSPPDGSPPCDRVLEEFRAARCSPVDLMCLGLAVGLVHGPNTCPVCKAIRLAFRLAYPVRHGGAKGPPACALDFIGQPIEQIRIVALLGRFRDGQRELGLIRAPYHHARSALVEHECRSPTMTRPGSGSPGVHADPVGVDDVPIGGQVADHRVALETVS